MIHDHIIYIQNAYLQKKRVTENIPGKIMKTGIPFFLHARIDTCVYMQIFDSGWHGCVFLNLMVYIQTGMVRTLKYINMYRYRTWTSCMIITLDQTYKWKWPMVIRLIEWICNTSVKRTIRHTDEGQYLGYDDNRMSVKSTLYDCNAGAAKERRLPIYTLVACESTKDEWILNRGIYKFNTILL